MLPFLGHPLLDFVTSFRKSCFRICIVTLILPLIMILKEGERWLFYDNQQLTEKSFNLSHQSRKLKYQWLSCPYQRLWLVKCHRYCVPIGYLKLILIWPGLAGSVFLGVPVNNLKIWKYSMMISSIVWWFKVIWICE